MTSVMPSVSMPCFISATKASDPGTTSFEDALFNDGELDFDLLADYLLEDTDINNFGPAAQNVGSVTPDTSDMDFADPLADQTYQIYPPSTQGTTQNAAIKSDPIYNQNDVSMTQTENTYKVSNDFHPSPVGPIPGPVATVPPRLAVPTSFPSTAPPTNFDPQAMTVHQHKRPRLDTSATAATAAATTTFSSIQSNNRQLQLAAIKPMNQAIQVQATTSHPSHPGSVHIINQMMNHSSGRQKSQAQIDRRRERNRILARRTRLRKKFFFESLQKDVTDLQKENLALKEIVRKRFEESKGNEILVSCNANEKVPQVVLEQCGDPSLLTRQDFNLMSSVKDSQRAFVITDPSLQDNPIVYVSEGFLELSGFPSEQVLGRNCRFLQGPETSQKKVDEIRQGLSVGDDVSVTFINYCADGTPFWNKLFIAALRDAQNNIVNYIGVSVKVAGPGPGDIEEGKVLPGAFAEGEDGRNATNEDLMDSNGYAPVDADAAMMDIEGAVTAAVAAAPNVVLKK
mmetsp:Transcript_20370/g.23612  ORF Transcript_20370/g.23612 Transcript_20370/m.23612 type:complete len:513 (-) Transcript_20370:269-1807(-)